VKIRARPTHNPPYWYLTEPTRELAPEKLAAAITLDGLEVVAMKKHLPADKYERDWCTPHDGHWSDLARTFMPGDAQCGARKSRSRRSDSINHDRERGRWTTAPGESVHERLLNLAT
jgi:hypothetical protein